MLKSVTSSSSTVKTLYLHGLSDYPLTESVSSTGTAIAKHYIYGPTGLIAIYENSHYYYAVKDHLGSIRVVLNGSDSLIAEWNDYLTYGGTVSQVNPDVHYRYTGQEQDNDISGNLYNYRARFYDGELGRFLAADPAHQYYSPFTFVGNNPVRFVDPTGMLGGNDLGLRSAREHNESNGFAARAQYNHMRGYDTPPAIVVNGMLQTDAGAAQAFFNDPQSYLNSINATSFTYADRTGAVVADGHAGQVWVRDDNGSSQSTFLGVVGPTADGIPEFISVNENVESGHWETRMTIDGQNSFLSNLEWLLVIGDIGHDIADVVVSSNVWPKLGSFSGALAKTKFIGPTAAGAVSYNASDQFSKGEISAGRFSYEAVTPWVAYGIGYATSAGWGLVAGAAFEGGEYVFDVMGKAAQDVYTGAQYAYNRIMSGYGTSLPEINR